MPSKKTGLFISAVNEPIVNKVMADNNFTKISNAINFIIQEYDKLSNQKQEVVKVDEDVKLPKNILDWFVVEDK